MESTDRHVQPNNNEQQQLAMFLEERPSTKVNRAPAHEILSRGCHGHRVFQQKTSAGTERRIIDETAKSGDVILVVTPLKPLRDSYWVYHRRISLINIG